MKLKPDVLMFSACNMLSVTMLYQMTTIYKESLLILFHYIVYLYVLYIYYSCLIYVLSFA